MQKFSTPIQIRWADIDQNRHLRHSVYYDYGAMARIEFLNNHGLTSAKFEELHIGPILFREEAIFKREIKFGDSIHVDVELLKASPDYARWSMRHNFIKADGSKAAIINIDGAWIDIVKRKLAVPTNFIQNIFGDFPRSIEFQPIMPSQK
ncbi:MAG: acyl-CoA thioesterase [Flammeovirgaceae bacterium]|nr:acyl-CoA thioesterase [Flammeovirgaceae bacterium]